MIFDKVKKIHLKYLCFVIIPILLLFADIIRSYSMGVKQSSRIFVIAIVTLASLYFKNKKYNQPIVQIAIVFSGLMTLYGLIGIPSSSYLSYIPSITVWVVILYSASNTLLSDSDLQMIGFIGAVSINLCAFYYISLNTNLSLISLSYEESVASFNTIYYVLLLLPFCLLINNKLLVLSAQILPMMAILESGKSTCIIAFFLSFLYYFYDIIVKSKKNIFFIIIAVVVIFSVGKSIVDPLELLQDLTDDFDSGGNGRTNIADKLLAIFFNGQEFLPLIFGYGTNGTLKAINIGAHNDFLEVLFNYGFLGFGLYLIFWIRLISYISKFNSEFKYKKVYIICLIVFFCCSIASKLLETQIQMLPPVLLLGLLICKNGQNAYSSN